MIGIIHKHDYYIWLWLMQGIRKMEYHLKRTWSVPVFNSSCISILAAYVLLAAWMWMITGFATICGRFWAGIHGWGWWYLVILAAKDAIHGWSAGPAQIPCAQLRFDRQRAHRGEGTAMVTESGDRPKSLDSGVRTEKFVRNLPTLTGLREDLQATMLFMLVLESFWFFTSTI